MLNSFICQQCGKQFTSYEQTAKYCNRSCYNLGHIPWNKGKKLHYMPPNVFRNGERTGSKHPRWKGGLWSWAKKQVYLRDKGICRKCGLNEPSIMEAAHIQPANGNHNRLYTPQDVDNLITLCPNDHKRFDKGLIGLDDILLSINPANSAKPTTATPS